MAEPVEIGAALASGLAKNTLISGALGIGNTLLSGLIGRSNMNKQVEQSKEMMDYQWDKFQSPQAQVSALAKAGLNPLVAFGKGGSQLATPTPSSVSSPSYAPVDLSLGLGVLGNYIKSMADAKKAGVEVPNIEQDTRIKQIEADAKQYDFELQKFFAVPERASNLTLAWKNVMLKQDEHNINQWIQAKEKALSEAKENERDILRKELDNMDTKLGLQNELLRQQGKTEQAKQNELSAAAESHRAQASLVGSQQVQQDFFNELRKTPSVRKSLIKEMEQLGDVAEQNKWLNSWEIEQARYAASQAAYADSMKEYSYWIDKISGILGTAAVTAGGIGALKHYSTLSKSLGNPKISTTENYNAFGEKMGSSVTTSNR